MSPARIKHEAPVEIRRFFERFRQSLGSEIPPELRLLHKPNYAEIRGGGDSEYKQYLQYSRFDDLKKGFYYFFWPDHLGLGRDDAALGLEVSFEPFERGVHHRLKQALTAGNVGRDIRELGFDNSANLPIHGRAMKNATWIVKRTVALSWTDVTLADDCGSRLGRLIAICHPVIRQVVAREFPHLLKKSGVAWRSFDGTE